MHFEKNHCVILHYYAFLKCTMPLRAIACKPKPTRSQNLWLYECKNIVPTLLEAVEEISGLDAERLNDSNDAGRS